VRLAPLIILAALSLPAATSAQSRTADQERLAALFTEREFSPSAGFRALVVRIDEGDDGALTQQFYDYAGTADDRDGWWPASSVKIYAAVAALEQLHEMGFPITAWLTFEYEDGPVTLRMDQLIRQALELSSNAAFDRLVEFVGSDRINTEFFVPENGFEDTVFLRAYAGRHTDEESGAGTNRFSPRIVVRRGPRQRVIPAREGRGDYSCPNHGNCTTLFELAEVMRRIMLHDELPEALRYDLDAHDLRVLRGALAVARNRELAELVREGFGETPVEIFHKPGFAYRQVTDVIYVHRTDTNERYVIAMSSRPGRRALDSAARTIGAILAAGELR